MQRYYTSRWSEVDFQLLQLKVPPPPLAYHTATACKSPYTRPFSFWRGHKGGLTRIIATICIPKREKTTASPSSLMCRCSSLHIKQNAAGFVGGSWVDTGP